MVVEEEMREWRKQPVVNKNANTELSQNKRIFVYPPVTNLIEQWNLSLSFVPGLGVKPSMVTIR